MVTCRQIGDKPISEPMLVYLLTHTCVTIRPQLGAIAGRRISVKPLPTASSNVLYFTRPQWVNQILSVVNVVDNVEYIDGLVQERRNFIANPLGLRISCTKPSIGCKYVYGLLWVVLFIFVLMRSGGRLNKKDGVTRYGDSHVKDKTS